MQGIRSRRSQRLRTADGSISIDLRFSMFEPPQISKRVHMLHHKAFALSPPDARLPVCNPIKWG